MPNLLDRAIETQNRTWARMNEIREEAEREGRDLTAEERTNWDAAEADLTRASNDIERLNRMAALDTVDRSGAVTTTGNQDGPEGADSEAERARYGEAFTRYLRSGLTRMSAEQQQLLEANFSEMTGRAQAAGVDTLGGYLVPEGFLARMTEAMKAYGGILGLATPVNTSTGNDLPWPTNDDTGNEGEILGENEEITELGVTVGQRKLKAHIYSSRMVKASQVLLQDSAFDLEAWLPRKLGERIGRRAARSFATGTGIDEPQGITVGIRVGKTGGAGQTTSITYDDLIDLEHSVDPAYREAGRCRFVMNDTMLGTLRKLKDGDGRPLWVPVPAPGFASTLNGQPYTIDNSMPAPAAGAKSIVFGDIAAGYVVRQVLAVQTLRLAERYAERLQVAFLSFARLDGMIDDYSAIKAYEHAAA
ncbi:phage major capsid protein [Streptomyces rubiginosohelvolus]|uniref:Phage capsid protein n=1 Tax=Streptomyces rubiginosohelvolus TaxID=67362 RepID=A0ABQ3BPA9_9ACTN|nr:phage major capsid protein [Streptomyces pluricolorescens]GGZ53228.1 phage capsid protein [Streptomyces pluricolorescens]